jgi:uncharacterized protein YdiU (UPF0061 family)
MDAYDPGTVFSSIDHQGRYAYGNQPRIALWNLTRLAECLLPLLETNEEAAKDALARFAPRFQERYFGGLRRKIGLLTLQEGDDNLAQDLLKLMATDGADFTLTFRGLCDAAEDPARDGAVAALFKDTAAYGAWAERWHARLTQETAPVAAMRTVNPGLIPRNHLVEAALAAAVERADFLPFETLLDVLSRPFQDDPALEQYTLPPKEDERVLQTFCGT